jgi:hypothetical protein
LFIHKYYNLFQNYFNKVMIVLVKN